MWDTEKPSPGTRARSPWIRVDFPAPDGAEMMKAVPRLLTRAHSHSMVAGGLEEMSYTTRFTPRTSLMMRLDMRPSVS